MTEKAYWVRHTLVYHVDELVYAESPQDARDKARRGLGDGESIGDDRPTSTRGRVLRAPEYDR